MSNGFDLDFQLRLASKEDEATAVHLVGADEKPLYYAPDGSDDSQPVLWYITGAHGQRYRNIDKQLRTRKLKASSLTGAALMEDNITRIVACSTGWQGIVSNNTPVDFRPDNARMILESAPWLVDLLFGAMHEHDRFFASSSSKL
jgi:hypothetical protein